MKGRLTDDESKFAIKNPKSVIAPLFFLLFLGVSDGQMLSPLLSLIAKDFDVTAGEAGMVLNGTYAVAASIAALFIGRLSDRYGRRRFLVAAVGIFASSLLFVAVVSDFRLFALLRFFTGFAGGIFSVCTIACIGDYFRYDKRGSAMSAVQAGYFAALVAGVPIASLLADRYGWRTSFVCLGLLALPMILFLRLLPDDGKRDNETLITGGIGSLFVNRERYAAICAAFFVSLGFAGFVQYLGSWLTAPQGLALKTADAGLFFIAFGLAALCGSFAACYFSDKIDKRQLSVICTLFLAMLLVAIPRMQFGGFLFVVFATASFIYAFRQGPLQALATDLISHDGRGTLIGMRSVASQIGIVLTSFICGQLYDAYGYSAVGLFSAVATLAAVICIALMRKPAMILMSEPHA